MFRLFGRPSRSCSQENCSGSPCQLLLEVVARFVTGEKPMLRKRLSSATRFFRLTNQAACSTLPTVKFINII